MQFAGTFNPWSYINIPCLSNCDYSLGFLSAQSSNSHILYRLCLQRCRLFQKQSSYKVHWSRIRVMITFDFGLVVILTVNSYVSFFNLYHCHARVSIFVWNPHTKNILNILITVKFYDSILYFVSYFKFFYLFVIGFDYSIVLFSVVF